MTVCVAMSVGCGGANNSTTTDPRTTPGATAQITSSTPAQNARGVAVDAPITVTVSADLDPAFVSTQTVQLMPVLAAPGTEPDPEAPAMQRIIGQVTYNNAARTLTFTPSAHMQHGADYHLVLSTVRAASGANLGSSAEIRFQTFHNNHVKTIVYDELTQQPVHTVTFEYDAADELVKINAYNGVEAPANLAEYSLHKNATLPGAPQIAVDFAAYDAVTNQLMEYGADVTNAGAVVAHAIFDGPGLDGLWNFSDDVIAAYEKNSHNHAGHTLFSHYAPIAASEPWSNDPAVLAGRFTFVHGSLRESDSLGRSFRSISYQNWGSNGPELDAAGSPKPVTDTVSSYRKFDYDAVGRVVRSWAYTTPGVDSAWLTADDVPGRITVMEFDASTGHLTRVVNYNSAGADGQWDTVADNDATSYATFAYAPGTANVTQRTAFITGIDNRVGGADDVRIAEEIYTTVP